MSCKLTRVATSIAALAPILREAGAFGEGDPIEIVTHVDRQGRKRKITARWADGWRMTVNLHLRGGCSISHAKRVVVTGGDE